MEPPALPNHQDLLDRALEAVTKCQSRLNSISKVASFAAWFVEQEVAWHPVTEDPPQGMLSIWDTTHNIVRTGWKELDGWHYERGSEKHFTPGKWQRIHF